MTCRAMQQRLSCSDFCDRVLVKVREIIKGRVTK